ncbi:PREDICTED: COMM domain-containing protein 8-like [Dufourea novaeangliae]|uniref:COMM domain-containing protein 8 n=1 Tax=Dufourea novaeangliae TaxID=178035 RepID=A0A154PSL4_DUFNO|nr:PREDICTED: COMM domain-containing protein 8-like [Dufourea novaeangliae]KZC14100.1 COMM domain-containing protein 8 [Dufourea novaeangliae]
METGQPLYLNLFSEDKIQVLEELLHACVDEICGRPGPSYHRFTSSIDWSREEYEETYKLISMLLRNPACLYLTEEKMPQEYHDLPEHIQQSILTCLKVRRDQLTNALLKECSKEKHETLVDFDWRLKLVMGSSKLASLREPLLQLDLMIENKEKKRILGLELNKDELETFINAVETIVK